ncbi:DMT family transporter [Thalassospira profundimaris]|uniref:DMT family transporter n=1 Tax=Thalassospira profundimaris TaxID=502049 RepID=UPI000DED65CC|nr:DMT family transporter [Thalassospira profundimaris]
MPKTPSANILKAVLAIVVSVLALSLGDAMIKATNLSLPLWQMFVLRSALTILPLMWLVWHRGAGFRVSRWTVLRSVLLVVMWLGYYASLPLVPLSLAAAAYYTSPIFILIIVAFWARKMPSARAFLAIIFGFVGVLCVIRPDTVGFDGAALLPVLAAILYACAMVLTSTKCQKDDPFVLAVMLNMAFILFGGLLGMFAGEGDSFLLGPWQAVSANLMLIVAGLAVLIFIGSVGAAIAYQTGPPALVAAFDYSYLVFSVIWGLIWFGEVPDVWGLAGIVLIVSAGLIAANGQKAKGAVLRD